jgi:uncharacterized protein (TIGR02598 family)
MTPRRPLSQCSAFSLVEVALALGIAAFCLVALMGMLPVGLTSSQSATAQTGAASLLTAVAADLRDTPLPSASPSTVNSPYFLIPVPKPTTGTSTTFYVDDGSNFSSTLSSLSNSRYRVTVTYLSSPTSGTVYSTLEQVIVSWPPQASVTRASGNVEGIVDLNRN